jgi:hypothetical protein
MIRLRRASMIATLSLLTWTATASAECAWVLWVQEIVSHTGAGQVVSEPSWRLVQAVPTYADCENGQAEVIKNISKPQQNAEISVAKTLVTRTIRNAKGITNFISHYHCVPDTVDPRGPKGK